MRTTIAVAALLSCLTTQAMAQEKAANATPAAPPAAGPAAPPAPAPAKKEPIFEFHGFISAVGYYEDGALGPAHGVYPMYANAPTETKRAAVSGDIRQSRFSLTANGPEIWGGKAKGVLEWDLLGGWGSGGFGDVSINQRLRLAYVEQNWGKHRLVIGQNNDLIIGIIPVSASHIGNPFTSTAGTTGWRRPGVFGYHTITESPSFKLEGSWEVGRSQWQDSAAPGAAPQPNGIGTSNGGYPCDRYGFCFGEASGLPAVQGRLTASNNSFMFWVAGHWNQIRRTAQNPAAPAGHQDRLDVVAANFGGRAVVGPVTVLGTAYAGKNMAGALGGDILQFIPNTGGSVHSWAGWAQVGFNFTKELSIWGLGGIDRENKSEAIQAGLVRLENRVASGLLQYREGPYQLGLEYAVFRTLGFVNAGENRWATGNQVLGSWNYFF